VRQSTHWSTVIDQGCGELGAAAINGSIHGERSVSWYENQADRLSMKLLKKLFADESLDLKSQLSLAQLVEEIDRVADQAEGIDLELRASRTAGLPVVGARDSH
jgi:hypothetical protein